MVPGNRRLTTIFDELMRPLDRAHGATLLELDALDLV